MALSRADCISGLRGYNPDLSEAEAVAIVDDMIKRKARLEADGKLTRGTADLADSAKGFYDAARAENAAKRRQAAISIIRRAGMEDFIARSKADGMSFRDALMAKLVGNPKHMFGARQSIDGNRTAILTTYVNQFEQGVDAIARRNGMTKQALSDLMAKDAGFRADFVQERMASGTTKDARVRDLVDLYDRISEEMRIRLNRAGANIGKLEGRLPQSHDPLRMLDRSGTKDDWIAFMEGALDMERSFPDLSPDEIRTVLSNSYDTIVNGMERVTGESESVSAVRTPRTIASNLGRRRVFHFKDAASYLGYMDRYGKRNLWESIMGEMEGNSRTLALMETLGPNPEHMVRSLIQAEKEGVRLGVEAKHITEEDGAKLQTQLDGLYSSGNFATGEVAKWMAVLTGETMRPANVGAAKAWGIVRSIQSMGKLGMATLSAVADLFTKGMNMRANGAGFLEAHGRAIADIFRVFTVNDKRLINDLGFYFELENGMLIHRFDQADTIPGKVHAMMNRFFKYSGLTQWTEKNKAAMAQWLSSKLGESRALDFDGLHPDIRAMLEYHGVDAARWDVYRKHMTESFDGRRYMNPSLARNLTNDQIAHLLPERLQGKVRSGFAPEQWSAARQAEFDRLRARIETEARAFYADETKFAVIEPDARTTATMTQGTRPGTAVGEALRMIMQFKSFPIAFWQRTMEGRRWVRGSLRDGMRYGFNSGSAADMVTRDTAGFVNYMISALAYGYIAMTLKDLAKGNSPKDPQKLETWMAAALQSGGAGIYGDFFLGKANRFGNNFLETLAGPTLGEISTIANALNGAFHGDVAGARDSLIRVGLGNIPYGNLWYTKAAGDWLFMDGIKEWMSPGYKRRMLRNMRKDYGQEELEVWPF